MMGRRFRQRVLIGGGQSKCLKDNAVAAPDSSFQPTKEPSLPGFQLS